MLGLAAPAALAEAEAEAKWAADGRAVYFTDYTDLFRARTLFRADPLTGATRALITDRAASNQCSFVAPNYLTLPPERSGWAQLYRYGADGRLKNAVTRGDWVVRELLHVDRGVLTFSAGGREAGIDPYLRQIYRVPIGGGAVRGLTGEEADHEMRLPGPLVGPFGRTETPPGFSADGQWFVDTYSRIDRPTVAVVRDARDGRVAMTLATARHASDAPVFAPPEPFAATAADGHTLIYGILIKPTGFDPARHCPVIDTMYAGPQTIFVPKYYGLELYSPYDRALAELGFVVSSSTGAVCPGAPAPIWTRAPVIWAKPDFWTTSPRPVNLRARGRGLTSAAWARTAIWRGRFPWFMR